MEKEVVGSQKEEEEREKEGFTFAVSQNRNL